MKKGIERSLTVSLKEILLNCILTRRTFVCIIIKEQTFF